MLLKFTLKAARRTVGTTHFVRGNSVTVPDDSPTAAKLKADPAWTAGTKITGHAGRSARPTKPAPPGELDRAASIYRRAREYAEAVAEGVRKLTPEGRAHYAQLVHGQLTWWRRQLEQGLPLQDVEELHGRVHHLHVQELEEQEGEGQQQPPPDEPRGDVDDDDPTNDDPKPPAPVQTEAEAARAAALEELTTELAKGPDDATTKGNLVKLAQAAGLPVEDARERERKPELVDLLLDLLAAHAPPSPEDLG